MIIYFSHAATESHRTLTPSSIVRLRPDAHGVSFNPGNAHVQHAGERDHRGRGTGNGSVARASILLSMQLLHAQSDFASGK
jgi:hypothetical protein